MIFKLQLNMSHIISHKTLTIDTIKTIIAEKKKLTLSQDAEAAIIKCRRYLDTKMEDIRRPVTAPAQSCDVTRMWNR